MRFPTLRVGGLAEEGRMLRLTGVAKSSGSSSHELTGLSDDRHRQLPADQETGGGRRLQTADR
jgi:hypothetical protein